VISGEVDEALIDESVLRILQLKEKLGLFENPYRGLDEALERVTILSEEHRQVARDLARKSCVLLKNDNVLPLQVTQKIALIGPFAQSGDILGPWSWQGSKDEAVQLFDGLKQKVDATHLVVSKGCDINKVTPEQLNEAICVAEKADVIILALGEDSEMSGEAGSRADIRLPEAQLQLVAKLREVNKPMVAVLFNGRPLDLHGMIDQVDAVLEAWYPGTEGGAAIADLLFGDANPSGRLTMSFPYSVGQVPVYYNHFNTGRPKDATNAQTRYVSQYLDIPNQPLFPFGFGLSYTTFEYSDAKLSSDHLTATETITASVTVTNTGSVKGEEVIQLYIRDMVGEVVRPVKELKAFKKVTLKPGESKEVTFEISENILRYYHADLTFASDAGDFTAYVGSNSEEVIALPFKLLK
jgi:beta-glucosidase